MGLCGESISQGLGPLDPTHFATLVVHLPSPHQGTSVLFGQYSITQPASADADWTAKGGALVVRYDGHDLVFSNDSTDSLTIGWTAFYSDCEHEFQAVQSGHYITLTYNLHSIARVGRTLQQPNPMVEPCQTILYELLKDPLRQPGFLADGNLNPNLCIRRITQQTLIQPSTAN